MMVFKTMLALLVLVLARSGMAVNDTHLLKAFKMIAEDAIQARNDINRDATNRKATQVLSISVFSDSELEGLNLIPEERRRIFLNAPAGSFSVPGYFRNKKEDLHGEIIALYVNDTINELLYKYSAADKENNIFVYSYFIPCAEVTNVPYSCAEEVAKASKFYGSRSRMFVGYSAIFDGTDEAIAKDFLLISGIKSVFDLRYEVIPEGNQPSSLKRVEFFQKLMHTCLMRRKSLCPGNPEREKIIAYQVNVLTKRCAKNSSFYGTISTFGLNFLASCLESEAWQPCCESRAKSDEIKLEVRKCMIDTMKDYKPTAMHSIQFGIVTDLTHTNWTHILGIETRMWSTLFEDLIETDPFPDDVLSISGRCLSLSNVRKVNGDQFGARIHQFVKDYNAIYKSRGSRERKQPKYL